MEAELALWSTRHKAQSVCAALSGCWWNSSVKEITNRRRTKKSDIFLFMAISTFDSESDYPFLACRPPAAETQLFLRKIRIRCRGHIMPSRSPAFVDLRSFSFPCSSRRRTSIYKFLLFIKVLYHIRPSASSCFSVINVFRRGRFFSLDTHDSDIYATYPIGFVRL